MITLNSRDSAAIWNFSLLSKLDCFQCAICVWDLSSTSASIQAIIFGLTYQMWLPQFFECRWWKAVCTSNSNSILLALLYLHGNWIQIWMQMVFYCQSMQSPIGSSVINLTNVKRKKQRIARSEKRNFFRSKCERLKMGRNCANA